MADGGGLTRQMQEVEKRFHQPIADLLERLYWGEQLTIPEVARKVGISPGATHRWLKKFGLTWTQQGRPQPRPAAAQRQAAR